MKTLRQIVPLEVNEGKKLIAGVLAATMAASPGAAHAKGMGGLARGVGAMGKVGKSLPKSAPKLPSTPKASTPSPRPHSGGGGPPVLDSWTSFNIGDTVGRWSERRRQKREQEKLNKKSQGSGGIGSR